MILLWKKGLTYYPRLLNRLNFFSVRCIFSLVLFGLCQVDERKTRERNLTVSVWLLRKRWRNLRYLFFFMYTRVSEWQRALEERKLVRHDFRKRKNHDHTLDFITESELFKDDDGQNNDVVINPTYLRVASRKKCDLVPPRAITSASQRSFSIFYQVMQSSATTITLLLVFTRQNRICTVIDDDIFFSPFFGKQESVTSAVLLGRWILFLLLTSCDLRSYEVVCC